MLPLNWLFVHLYVLIDDAIKDRTMPIPARPGPPPACTDAEILTIALARHLHGSTSEHAWLRQVRADWSHYFPRLPHQSEVNRRTRWLWGAFELLRTHLAAQVGQDPWQQIDTTALPVKHPSRVRGPDSWAGPNDLVAGFGRDVAHGEWFYGFRLGLRCDLDSRIVRSWEITRAAVNDRGVAQDLLEQAAPPVGLLLDRGFAGRGFARAQAERGTRVVLAPTRAERRTAPASHWRPVAVLRNRIETTNGEITEIMGLARHGAHTFWGLLTRTAAVLCAHTLWLVVLKPTNKPT
ncbi:IS982 family transposase [Nocardiopsis lambiniae]|uniref:IS982 family transposase n=1 Tax=Nocardiopsis lambiniae TaxID=3075539 RepID=A0ABU2MES8_9ACTN|nr:IS982 family transposase [Nocardiopsis sp. DSM 44743]MDT0331132.1 IS982 family transposase [Nocardiopsis sp. DSM 44743]